MNNDIEHPENPNKNKAIAGVILLAIGGIFLLRQFSFFIMPGFLFSWPMVLIIWGIYIGAKHNYKKASWVIMVILGVVFLINENVNNSGNIVWPVAIIAFGLWLILRKGKHGSDPEFWERHNKDNKWDKKEPFQFDKTDPVDYRVKDETGDVPPVEPAEPFTQQQQQKQYSKYSGDDYIDTVSIFGGVNKIILSKQFRGGDIVNIFGGAELDFTQADINGRVIIDITQIFGGTKIIVPSNWQVVSDLAAVFASVDDKRIRSTAALNSDKVLVLKGVSIFAGVDIRSY